MVFKPTFDITCYKNKNPKADKLTFFKEPMNKQINKDFFTLNFRTAHTPVKFRLGTLFIIASFLFCASDSGYGQFFLKNRSDKNGNRHGKWIHYWDGENSKVYRKGRYKHGIEVKKWKYYDWDGHLTKTEKYNRIRNSIHIKNYYPGKKTESEGNAVLQTEQDSLLHFFWQGEWKIYDRDNKLIRKEYYQKGKKTHEVKIL